VRRVSISDLSFSALREALQQVSASISDRRVKEEFEEYAEELLERAASEPVDFARVCADLMSRFSVPRQVVERFLDTVLSERPGKERLIAGTIAEARRVRYEASA